MPLRGANPGFASIHVENRRLIAAISATALSDTHLPCLMFWIMDIACPACSTRYVVPDSSIGVNGRVVRCAKCRHSWFQDGPEPAAGAPAVLTPTVPETAAPAAPAPAENPPAPPPDETAPIYTPSTYTPGTYADPPPAPDFAATPSSFAYEPPFRPRRNPAFFWILGLVVFAIVAIAAVAAMANFGVPDWLPLPRNTFAGAPPDLQLNFPQNQQEWRPLPDGNSFFNVSGSITNSSRERRTVPTLEIVLRDARNAVVYRLETASPKPVLAPGESETINQAIIDAPKSARTATMGWKAR